MMFTITNTKHRLTNIAIDDGNIKLFKDQNKNLF